MDSMVAGAVHTTAATVRRALQILGTKPRIRLMSSGFSSQEDEDRAWDRPCGGAGVRKITPVATPVSMRTVSGHVAGDHGCSSR